MLSALSLVHRITKHSSLPQYTQQSWASAADQTLTAIAGTKTRVHLQQSTFMTAVYHACCQLCFCCFAVHVYMFIRTSGLPSSNYGMLVDMVLQLYLSAANTHRLFYFDCENYISGI